MTAQQVEQARAGIKLVQVLDDLSSSQIEAIRKIPPHDAAQPSVVDHRRPASMFLSDERFEEEQQKIFRKYAVPLTISALVAEPGTVLAHEHYGVPLVITRDMEGQVRVFLNACMHKGSKLVEKDGPKRAKKMTCPYHAWTFALDGRLVAVPREETFGGLNKCDRGLKELACREAGGVIWSMLDHQAEPDFSNMNDQLIADMDAFDLPAQHVYGRKTFHLKSNWKQVLEPFLEGYHVQRLHAQSVGPMFADVPNVTDVLGRNIRQISGKMNFTPDCLDLPEENIHKSVTHAYQIFPNLVVVTSPYYISIMFIIPVAAGETIVDYMMLTRAKPDNDKAKELYARSYEMILGVFGGEDFRAAEISYAGLSSGALDEVVYCGLEETIPLYYDIMDKLL